MRLEHGSPGMLFFEQGKRGRKMVVILLSIWYDKVYCC